jgi:hypothetical protein
VTPAAEAELDAVMDESLAPEAAVDLGLREEVDRALLEHSGPDPLLDVLPASGLEYDRLDAAQPKEVSEKKARRSGADDRDLSPHDR